MSLALSLLAISWHAPLRPAAVSSCSYRVGCPRAQSASDDAADGAGMSFRTGDLLTEIVSRQLKELSPEEMLARDERIIDAMLANGVAELYAELAELDESLGLVEHNSSAAMRSELERVETSVEA